jgi:hypothetical protein
VREKNVGGSITPFNHTSYAVIRFKLVFACDSKILPLLFFAFALVGAKSEERSNKSTAVQLVLMNAIVDYAGGHE